MERHTDIIQIVDNLNAYISELRWIEDGDVDFTYSTNGYEEAIYFGCHKLWDSSNVGRKWDKKTGDYEPLEPYIKKQFNKMVDRLQDLKFPNPDEE